MKVIVFGATGGTGREIVDQALARGHEVTAFVHETPMAAPANEEASENSRLRFVTGDVLNFAQVQQAIQGQEAVICALGSKSLGKTTVRSAGTSHIIKAMVAEQVDRLLVVSAMGIGESWDTLSSSSKFFFSTVLRNSRRDHEAQEVAVKESNLAWTIVRPSGLVDGEVTGNYAIGENILAKSSRITRADVAHAIMKELDEGALVHKAVTITN